MKSKKISIIILALSLLCFIISAKSFYSISIFSDQYNTSPDVILGSELWLYMYWIKMVIILIIGVLSYINLSGKEK